MVDCDIERPTPIKEVVNGGVWHGEANPKNASGCR